MQLKCATPTLRLAPACAIFVFKSEIWLWRHYISGQELAYEQATITNLRNFSYYTEYVKCTEVKISDIITVKQAYTNWYHSQASMYYHSQASMYKLDL